MTVDRGELVDGRRTVDRARRTLRCTTCSTNSGAVGLGAVGPVQACRARPTASRGTTTYPIACQTLLSGGHARVVAACTSAAPLEHERTAPPSSQAVAARPTRTVARHGRALSSQTRPLPSPRRCSTSMATFHDVLVACTPILESRSPSPNVVPRPPPRSWPSGHETRHRQGPEPATTWYARGGRHRSRPTADGYHRRSITSCGPASQGQADRPMRRPGRRRQSAQRSTPRTRPLVGTPVPAVTTTCSRPGTWLTEVPRTSRTPSAMPFMPCR